MKGYSTWLDINKVQIRTSVWYHYTLPEWLLFKYNLQCQAVGRLKEKKFLCTDNKNVNWEFGDTAESSNIHTLLFRNS